MLNDGKGLRTKLLASVAIGMMAITSVGGGLMPAAEAQGFSSFSASGTAIGNQATIQTTKKQVILSKLVPAADFVSQLAKRDSN